MFFPEEPEPKEGKIILFQLVKGDFFVFDLFLVNVAACIIMY